MQDQDKTALIVANLTACADSLARLTALTGSGKPSIHWDAASQEEYDALPGVAAVTARVELNQGKLLARASKIHRLTTGDGEARIFITLARPATAEEIQGVIRG